MTRGWQIAQKLKVLMPKPDLFDVFGVFADNMPYGWLSFNVAIYEL